MSVPLKTRVLIQETLKKTLKEWDATLKQESSWRKLLNVHQGRLRGVKLTDLRLDTSYFKHVDSNGDFEIKLHHTYPNASIARAFRRGKLVDVVLPSKSGEKDTNWSSVQGIISEVQSSAILVQVSHLGNNFLLPSFAGPIDNSEVNLYQRSSSAILEKSAKALKNLKIDKTNFSIAACLMEEPVQSANFEQETPFFSKKFDLDPDKVQTVHLCSQGFPITVIHGPPGTGKTTALASVIVSALANGSRVLATAPSHAAVDALTIAILTQLDSNRRLVRIGNVLRLKNPMVADWLPKTNVEGLSEQLVHLRLELLQKSRGRKDLIERELRLTNEIKHALMTQSFNEADQAQVVVSTCLSALQMPSKVKRKFDVICIDEAAFAPDWLSLPLILSGVPRTIMSGDHYQLPPIMVSDDANTRSVSIMERIVEKVPTATLNMQFRSNELIPAWSNARFYKNKLQAHPSVKNITIKDLLASGSSDPFGFPFLFVNTEGLNFSEQNDEDGSIFNEHEALIVDKLVEKLVEMGIKPNDIGIITPYWSQVALLRQLIDEEQTDISTVDGFQGCEKEIILISFVRSNPQKVIGFLEELRRINVSITRAKRCCIVIGDASTLQPKLKSLVKFCQNHNLMVHYSDFEAKCL